MLSVPIVNLEFLCYHNEDTIAGKRVMVVSNRFQRCLTMIFISFKKAGNTAISILSITIVRRIRFTGLLALHLAIMLFNLAFRI